MGSWITRVFSALGLVILALGVTGCPPEPPLGGTEIPNAYPNTYISGEHPSLLESGFIVHFYWYGSDPDGQVAGFQWKLSHNGTDGISVHDTLTCDPATGAILNPWRFTAGSDTTLIVSADLAGYPEDAGLSAPDQRSWQTHTFFVRAVDAAGAVDDTPAFVSFTATTICPRVAVDRPERLRAYRDAQAAPPTLVLGYTGGDSDFDYGAPTKVRFLLKTAWHLDHYIRTRYEFDHLVDDLVVFSDSLWSGWRPYPLDPDKRFVTYEQLPAEDTEGRQITYLFAIQAQDTAGAVSVDRIYARNVQNVFISRGMTPQLTMRESHLGQRSATGQNSSTRIDITSGQVLQFTWVATADDYAGHVTSYRFGWDLADPDDESDPNWAVQPGNTPQHRQTPSVSFSSGSHSLTIQAWDDSNQLTRFVWLLEVVPVPEPAVQSPLLLVDNVNDQMSNAWTAADGVVPLDNDLYRDNFWLGTLDGPGGVQGFNPGQDILDTETSSLRYRDVVSYRTLLWTSRYSTGSFVWRTFKPLEDGSSRFIWLTSYQESVGNVFLVGSRLLNEFLEEKRWMIPWIFTTSEETYQSTDFGSFDIGFGQEVLPDGTRQLRGPQRYPFRGLGVTVLDHTSPKYPIYALPQYSQQQRRSSACVGVKALVLDPTFRSRYMPEGLAVPDTIYTDRVIDWRDEDPDYRNRLQPWVWGNDEFYDGNISPRTTAWQPAVCDEEPCLETMFRAYPRYDWVSDLQQAAGKTDWPRSLFPGPNDLQSICGHAAISPISGRTLVEGQSLAFISHRLEENKPNRRGDVVWGFDPYRFAHEPVRQAIHWVLGEYFGLTMRP